MQSSIYGYLTYFHEIVNEGSIAAAARKLEIAPPAVSNALKLLERHLGLPLFTRTTRKMELTEAGQRLFDSTRDIIQGLDSAMESVRDLALKPSGLVRVTTSSIAYLLVVKPYFAEFCRRYPDIRLEISVNDGIVDIVKDGFDVGIRFGDRLEQNVVAKKLLDPVRLGLYASENYIRKYGKPETLQDLSRHKLLGYRFVTANRIYPLTLNQDGREISVDIPHVIVTNNVMVELDSVRQGVALGLLFEPVVNALHDREKFIPVLEKHWTQYPELFLFYMQHSQKAGRVRAWIDFLLEKTSA
ncbi:LysR family transcriptional regulator [Exercitatus varius]|uniref:LysR family transcriptional regulator n=1 Tax=Exercitatus varius TaxID=67857 RepID=UPI0018A5D6C2|nr:LysR family transcriptional regulator [Exercitatus varius]MDG2942142.1 LysR family transcriptional regulator [Exercitatus varius]QOF67628.1 LysR family transcriptional regulator [Actinobacillus sp. GY-402]